MASGRTESGVTTTPSGSTIAGGFLPGGDNSAEARRKRAAKRLRKAGKKKAKELRLAKVDRGGSGSPNVGDAAAAAKDAEQRKHDFFAGL